MPSLVSLLAAVDDRPPHESGAFVVDDGAHALGSVFVEDARVCWAAAAGRGARLRELLHRHSARPLDDRELDYAFERCRDEERPLGEWLVEHGLVSDDNLRAALRQHTIESLICQCDRPDGRAVWVPHRRRGYYARFVFAPAELLAAAGAALYAAESAGAETALAPVAPEASVAGSFAIGDDGEPVLVHTAGPARVLDLAELGAWAAAALDACNGFSPAVMAHAIAVAGGPTAIGWRSARRQVHAAVIADPCALGSAIADLMRQRAPVVLSARVPRRAPSPFPTKDVQPTTAQSAT